MAPGALSYCKLSMSWVPYARPRSASACRIAVPGDTCASSKQPSACPCSNATWAAGSAGERKAGGVVVNKEKREVIIPAKIAPRKIDDPRYKEVYPIEVIATYPFPRGAKAHETVVTYDVKPSEVHRAVEGLGLRPGKPARTLTDVPKGPEVKIFIELSGGKRVPVEKALVDRKTKLPMPKVKWRFTGSATRLLFMTRREAATLGGSTTRCRTGRGRAAMGP